MPGRVAIVTDELTVEGTWRSTRASVRRVSPDEDRSINRLGSVSGGSIMTQEEGAQDESKSTAEPRRSSMNSPSSVSATTEVNRGSNSTSSPSSPPPGGKRHTEETVGPAVLDMGSADSAGNARSPSCGLVRSLLPNSCRGSAEAFARCLHRRLTSLGCEDGPAGAAKPRESSWLRPTSSTRHHSIGTNHVLQSQPRHSSESEFFYHVELDDDDHELAGSPADETTAAELTRLLVNCPDILKTGHHDRCHCSPSGATRTKTTDAYHDSETSCVFVSPITGTSPDSDSSEVFFDPDSSDTDRLRPEQFFDPLGTSDSEVTSNVSAPPRTQFDGPRRTEEKEEEEEEEASSESSCSSLPRRNRAIRENARICSSDENSEVNGRSSQETTTSPSSLWSTFDESTVSLQDDDCSPSDRRIRDSVPSPIVPLPKSHSDSELQPSNGIVAAIDQVDAPREVPQEDRIVQWSDDRVIGNNDEYSPFGHSDNLISKGREEEEEEEEKEEEEKGDGPSSRTDNGTSDESDSVCDNTLDSPDALEPSNDTAANEASDDVNREYAKSTETEKYREEATSWIEGGDGASNDDEKKLRLLLKKLNDDSRQRASAQDKDTSPDECQECQAGEAAEEEEDRPQRVRRCSSLKTGKTPPGTPRRKKIVRFADKLGLDLADVRTFLDEIPRVPNSAYNDLIYDDAAFRQQDSGPVLGDWSEQRCPGYQENSLRRRSTSASSARKVDRMLVPLFQQPGGMVGFLDMVRERRVCLENVLVQDPVTLAIQGTVRVINIDYHKSVHIRYTLNAWRNFSDLQATYVPNSCDGFSDKFSFVLYCHTLTVGQRLEFAVRFQCKGAQYWDNNTGANYCFQCLPASSPGYIPITADENHGWSPAFY